jgi:hypothetical protein
VGRKGDGRKKEGGGGGGEWKAKAEIGKIESRKQRAKGGKKKLKC